MKSFSYTITDPQGIHARPAGLLARTAKAYGDTMITIERGGDVVRASQIMRLMGMGIKRGDEVIIAANGASEDAAIEAMQEFFRNNL